MGCQCVSRKSDIVSNEFKVESTIIKNPTDQLNYDKILNENLEKSQVNLFRRPESGMPPPNNNSTGDDISLSAKVIINTQELLSYINQIRQSPKDFINLLEKYQSSIVKKADKYYIQSDNETFINLSTGIEAFKSAILLLQKQKALFPYKMIDELKLSFPAFNPSIATDAKYQQKIIFQKAKELKDRYDIINFHYDQIIYNPELAVLLQVVDDTNSGFLRRKNIFSEQAKYIGISGGKVKDNLYCFYYLFAKQRKQNEIV